MAEMIDTRMVKERQQFILRIWSNHGNWYDVSATNAADAIAKNDAAIAARDTGLIKSFAVHARWQGVEEGEDINITDDLKLEER